MGGLERIGEVWRLQTEHTSRETAERRKKWVDDARKAKAYRVLNGLEPEDGQGLEVGDLLRKLRNEKGSEGAIKALEAELDERTTHGDGAVSLAAGSNGGEEYVDFEGNKQPVKKWLGIW